jgi:hypothetical protein
MLIDCVVPGASFPSWFSSERKHVTGASYSVGLDFHHFVGITSFTT